MQLDGIIVKHSTGDKLRGSSQYELVLVKDRNVATISNKERVIGRWVEHLRMY